MMDRLNERVQIVKDLLERGKIIIYGPGQRVPEQSVSERVPVCGGNNASFEDIAKHGKERGFQITLRRGTLSTNNPDDEKSGKPYKGC